MNKRGMSLSAALVCGAIVATACGGGDDNNNSPGPSSAGSSGKGASKSDAGESAMPEGGSSAGKTDAPATAGQADVDPSAGGEGGAGGGSAAPRAPAFVSKPAGVELVLDDATKAAGFTLVSSNFTQKPSGSQFYREWYAELLNGTTQPQCFIKLNADFQSASGASLQKLMTYTYGASFDIGSSVGLTATCAAPGEVVPIWSNALDGNKVAVDTIKKLSITVSATEKKGAVVHRSTPTLANLMQVFEPGLQWWNFSGDATATADVYNVQVEFWGKSDGVIVGKSAAFHLDNFLKGSVWKFKTQAGISTTTLASAKPYVSFIDGLDSAFFVHYDPETAQLMELKQAATDSWKAADEREARAR